MFLRYNVLPVKENIINLFVRSERNNNESSIMFVK